MQFSSFDIFDTCLIRACGSPQFVFELLAEKAFTQRVSTEEKRLFINARIGAASISWSENQTLTEIYDAFSFEHPHLLPTAEIKTLELQIERENLEPVSSTLKLVKQCREAGHQIVFISDMYLSSLFLTDILKLTGFWEEGDKIYVSCEYGMTKASGKLFEYIGRKENISYKKWHHYGDNMHSDVKIPKKIGIKSSQILHPYTPYQKRMLQCSSLYYQWGGILAGLSRSITIQDFKDAHKCFFIDIIAPLFVSFVYRVMKNAWDKKINKLFFCARDAYPLYRVALQFKDVFPELEVEYLYISRKSLYEGDDSTKLGYFKQIGLAVNGCKNAIVDIRSTGKTLLELNSLLQDNGYDRVYGYLFELCKHSSKTNKDLCCSVEIDGNYIQTLSRIYKNIPSNWYMYELFFPLNSQKRTLAYEQVDGNYQPVFEEIDVKEYRLANYEKYIDWRNTTLDEYTRIYIELGLHLYSDKIFESYALPTLSLFLLSPDKFYLKALANFYAKTPAGDYVPYVDNSYLRLPLNIFRRKTMWKRGTIFYTLPTNLAKLFYSSKI